MSNTSTKQPQTLISQLLIEDEDLRDIVEEFVGALDSRLTELREAYDKLDWELLRTLAHRLKGAGGSYGYPDISQLCALMEQRFRVQDASKFDEWMAALSVLVTARPQRARGPTKPPPHKSGPGANTAL